MQKPISIRKLAVQILDQWEQGHVYAESLIQQTSQTLQLSKEDRNLLNTIVINTLRNLRLIDFWILQLRDGKLDEHTRNILRCGLCQLHIVGIASHAAVNETVNVAKKSTKGLINALLRKSLREKDSLEKLSQQQAPAVQFSHPDWLTDRWTNTFGIEQTTKLLQWNQQPAQTIFRLNPLKNEAHHILTELTGVQSIDGHPDYFLSEGLPPKQWIEDGLIYIQDPATSHAVDLLAPMPGEQILDACAAPGGKSTQIAAHMQNAGKLICTDSNAKRLPRLEQNLQRQGVSLASTEQCDWLCPPPEHFLGRFDGILLDVPCSNTGVLRRRIDARWRLTSHDISDLVKIQLKILENALPCLKQGGRIVYSTCSIDDEENRAVIDSFIASHPTLSLSKEHCSLPQRDQTDGAYAALLTLK